MKKYYSFEQQTPHSRRNRYQSTDMLVWGRAHTHTHAHTNTHIATHTVLK